MPFIYSSGGRNAAYYPTGKVRDGRPIYCVTHSIIFHTSKVGKLGTIIVVPEGFLTDLASIPTLPFFPNPGGSLWDDAAIVHDKACLEADADKMTFKEADAAFYHALRERGCNVFTAVVLWLAVRANHLVKGQG